MSKAYHTHLDVDSEHDVGDKLSSDEDEVLPVNRSRYATTKTQYYSPTRRTLTTHGGNKVVQPPIRDSMTAAASKSAIQQRVFPVECHFWYKGGSAPSTANDATIATSPLLPPTHEADARSVNAEVWLVRNPLKAGQRKAEDNFEIQVFCLERRIKLETIPLLGLGAISQVALPRGGKVASNSSSLSSIGAKHDAALLLNCSHSIGPAAAPALWISSILFAGKVEPVNALQAMLKAAFASAQRIRAQHEAAPSRDPRLQKEMQRTLDLQERARKLLEDGKYSLEPGAANLSTNAVSPQRDVLQAIDALSEIDHQPSSTRKGGGVKVKGAVSKRRAIPKGITMEYLQRQGVGIGSLPSHSAPFVEELSEVESLPSMVLSDDDGDF